MRVGPALVLVYLVVLAGCSGLGEQGLTARSTSTDAPSTTESTVPGRTATPAPPPSSETTATSSSEDTATPPRNPWEAETVSVTVNDTIAEDRNVTVLVKRALTYWNGEMDRYTNYSFRFVRAADPEAADVEVRIVDDVVRCGSVYDPNATGCASLITPGERVRGREVVTVEGGRPNASLVATAKHEFGHLLGLDHGDEPRILMAHEATDADLPEAGDRRNPWYAERLSVYVATDQFDGPVETVRAEVGDAVGFYDRSANGTVPRTFSFETTEKRFAAEVLVTNNASLGCGGTTGSTLLVDGKDLDGDRRLEKYTRAVVCVDGLSVDALGWHTGYWLGAAMGLDESERAAVFRTAGVEERRGEWWE